MTSLRLSRPTIEDAMRLDPVTAQRRAALRPDQEAAIRRWASFPNEPRPISPEYWQWLLRPDEQLAEFLAKTPAETAAFVPDRPESPDGPSHDRRPWLARVLLPRITA